MAGSSAPSLPERCAARSGLHRLVGDHAGADVTAVADDTATATERCAGRAGLHRLVGDHAGADATAPATEVSATVDATATATSGCAWGPRLSSALSSPPATATAPTTNGCALGPRLFSALPLPRFGLAALPRLGIVRHDHGEQSHLRAPDALQPCPGFGGKIIIT